MRQKIWWMIIGCLWPEDLKLADKKIKILSHLTGVKQTEKIKILSYLPEVEKIAEKKNQNLILSKRS